MTYNMYIYIYTDDILMIIYIIYCIQDEPYQR